MQETSGTITHLLQQWRLGDRDAENQLVELVLPRLHRLAVYLMQRERTDHTSGPTVLVDEEYVQLVAAADRDWHNRQYFFAIAGRAMRRLLVGYAQGRPPVGMVALEEIEALVRSEDSRLEQAVEIDRYLDELSALEPDRCTIVELKFFVGLSDEETADATRMSLRTVQRMWRDARYWLFQRLEASKCRTQPETTNG